MVLAAPGQLLTPPLLAPPKRPSPVLLPQIRFQNEDKNQPTQTVAVPRFSRSKKARLRRACASRKSKGAVGMQLFRGLPLAQWRWRREEHHTTQRILLPLSTARAESTRRRCAKQTITSVNKTPVDELLTPISPCYCTRAARWRRRRRKEGRNFQ